VFSLYTAGVLRGALRFFFKIDLLLSKKKFIFCLLFCPQNKNLNIPNQTQNTSENTKTVFTFMSHQNHFSNQKQAAKHINRA
jgi:hypothetical protein